MSVKNDSDYIPDDLWNSFRPAPISRRRQIVAVLSLVALPLFCLLLKHIGVPRPNLAVHRTDMYFEYNHATDVIRVDWSVSNNGYFPVTINAVDIDGMSPVGATEVRIPAGETAVITEHFEAVSTTCRPGAGERYGYGYWSVFHSTTRRDLAICQTVRTLRTR